MSDEELPSPRAKHYRGEFKRRKETSELIEWILDEFEQTEQRYEHALRKLKRAIRNEAAYHHLMDACQQTLTSPLPLNTLASALASALRWSIRMNWYAERHRAFMEAIEPILAIKGRVYAMTIPRLLVYPDGHREVDYNFTPEQQRILDQCDEHIAYIKEQAYKQPYPWSPLGDH